MRHIARFVRDTADGERAKFVLSAAPLGFVRLDSGSPSFPTPGHIVAAVKEALDAGLTEYIFEKGDAPLLDAICETVANEAGALYAPSQVLVTHGASSGIYSVMTALLDPGDEVIVFDPSYSLYAYIARQLGAIPVAVSHDAFYQLDVHAVESALTPKTRLVLLNNPNNPTGMVYQAAALEALGELCARNNLLLVSDEAYSKILQPGYTHIPALKFQAYRDNIILLGTFSKNYAMTGWRLGYIVAPPDLIDTIYRVHRAINGPICTFVQRAGVAALRDHHDWLEPMNRAYHLRARLAHRLAAAVPGLHPATPQGGFYLWCRYDADISSAELRARLLNRGVAVRSGSEYGSTGESHIRISYSADEATIEKGMGVVADVIREL